MDPFWFFTGLVLYDVVLSSGLDHCDVFSSSSQSESSLMKSLQCYNNYESYVQCEWKNERNAAPLQVWIQTHCESLHFHTKPCVLSDAGSESEDERLRCRYETDLFTIGIQHTVFFLNNKTNRVCSTLQPEFQNLVQHLRSHPPLNLSSFEERDGGQRLQWSSPYPASSSLNQNLMFQLSYRMQNQDNWTIVNVKNTSLKLEKQMLQPGCTYEARVRTRASLGQWSQWSPVVTWQTRADLTRVPRLHCVLDGDSEVTCSWKVSVDLAHLITYQLICRQQHAVQFDRCCMNPTVSFDPSEAAVTYSCSLNVTDPKHLELSLLRAHNAKTFQVHQHIHPDPPQNVTVSEKDGNWIVKWTKPATSLSLFYQVCYYRTLDQRSPKLLNISDGSMSLTIPGTSLTPLQDYQVKVRSLVVPGEGSRFEGIPSDWTDPVYWTSNEAAWSLSRLIYVFIGVLSITVFLTLYCTVSVCRRKVMLWVDSVPSPSKSKILSEIKSASSPLLMQSEKTAICKVQHLDSISSHSSEALLLPSKGSETVCVDQNTKCWNCEKPPSLVEKPTCSDTSSISFSGPYIFCQVSTPVSTPVNVQQKKKDREPSSEVHLSLFPVTPPLYGKDYVCLPNQNVSKSTQDLSSPCGTSTSLQWCGTTEQDQHCPDVSLWPSGSDNLSSLDQSTSSRQTSDYTTEQFSSWPQAGAVQASGYCHLPTTSMTDTK